MSTYRDGYGRERYTRCGCLIGHCDCIAIPPGGYEAEATPEQIMQAACPLCSAAPGDPCDGSKHSLFVLGIFIRGLPHVHTARYLSALRAKQAA